jgi:hypothetical protein
MALAEFVIIEFRLTALCRSSGPTISSFVICPPRHPLGGRRWSSTWETLASSKVSMRHVSPC